MRMTITYPVCEFCHERILPWNDSSCVDLGSDTWAHQDCVKKEIRKSNLPDPLKDYAEDAILYGEWCVDTPSWEEDGTEI